MIKISELKEGDIIMVDNEGTTMEGEVLEVNNGQKLALIETNGQQEFWYAGDVLSPIPLSDESLRNLSFERHENEDGTIKYMKGAFRLQIEKKDDFNHLSFWYREDRRHVNQPISVHQFQNYYLDMTKVHLSKEPI